MEATTEPRRHRGIAPGSFQFIVLMSMGMAVTALSIDAVLPAYGHIRDSLGMAADDSAVTGLVTFYFMGSGVGLIPAGLLADRYGRRPVMWGGLMLFALAAAATAFMPTLSAMLVTRFAWGMGSAGPRVAALAMVRDVYEGEEMARMMSLIMAAFILVPTIAPSLGSAILVVGPWQWIVWFCALFGVVVALGVFRLPETLPVEHRRPLDLSEMKTSMSLAIREPGMVGYLIAFTLLTGAFMSYLASSQLVIDKVFGLDRWFPLIFGAIAITMGAGMVFNSWAVERVGLDRLTGWAMMIYLIMAGALLAIALVNDGVPPFWLFLPAIAGTLLFLQMLGPNINSAAMRPMAAVAGTAAALLGMVSSVFGALLGGVVDHEFNATITPIAIGMMVYGLVAAVSWRWATRSQLMARQAKQASA
ncbi:MAG: hypothetical protein CSA55_00280 [Ilumatobacter coccineus]|uniref:Major facilitator superfamily (MFS) profile domain-containing protein n=1 Tax=Ilumatobacter coccineus TaxID=467094 RepID=A0A2G6KGE8_9ACTN|nr:MAG: hypothetical protein CSA55_00280 [Ilumatobacter coccineus]